MCGPAIKNGADGMAKAIDYMVCPFTPELLQRLRAGREVIGGASDSTPIEFPGLFMAGLSVADYLAFMDEASIEKSLVASVKFGTISHPTSRLIWDVTPEEVKAIVDRAPDRFRGVYGINPITRMNGVRELERAVKEYGFVAAYIHPYEFGPLNHRMWYPFYTKCIELDVPVISQTGHSGERSPLRTAGRSWSTTSPATCRSSSSSLLTRAGRGWRS